MTEKKATTDDNKNLPGKKGNTAGKQFSSTYQPDPKKISEGMARAKSIREWKAAIREKIFQEYFSRDLKEFSNKEMNQALRTAWDDETKEAEEHQAPVINYIENVNKDNI